MDHVVVTDLDLDNLTLGFDEDVAPEVRGHVASCWSCGRELQNRRNDLELISKAAKEVHEDRRN